MLKDAVALLGWKILGCPESKVSGIRKRDCIRTLAKGYKLKSQKLQMVSIKKFVLVAISIDGADSPNQKRPSKGVQELWCSKPEAFFRSPHAMGT
jgi:hypothetical protein